ncbi:MAG: aldo/keto reductase [Acidobacteria bacterium]|nr:aldo/keto reductase [Acidobacteriota bacterium]
MQYRELGRTGYRVSQVSFGAWAIGGSWGATEDRESLAALHQAVNSGVNFFDTADVYGDGRSERLLAQLKRERPDAEIIIATKAGRRSQPHTAAHTAAHTAERYNAANLTAYVERSLQNLNTDALDLVQLHCPPTDVYYRPEVFAALDRLVEQGKIRFYGVSVERVEEAMKALEYPNVQSVQIIFNCFRQRPADRFFCAAFQKQVGILARLPLSSGMLTGKLTRDSQFAAEDHRNFNRYGAAFDAGETFSGIDYDTQLQAVEQLKALVPPGMTLAQFALRWIAMFEAVTCSIPGAKNPLQVAANCAAAEVHALCDDTMLAVQKLYEDRIKPLVHHRW